MSSGLAVEVTDLDLARKAASPASVEDPCLQGLSLGFREASNIENPD